MQAFRKLSAAAALIVVTGACGGGAQPFALVASSPGSLEVGPQRVLLGLIDPESQEFLASPEVAATADFTGPGGESISDVPLEFMWGVPDVRGLYRAVVDLPAAGTWSVTIAADGLAETEPTPLLVEQETAMPQVGDPAPPVATRTSADADLSTISSDPEPDPDLYRLSLDDALADDRPTVIVFATPAFCTSQTCGPVLDNVKVVAAEHPEADFVHVEIYENLDADSFEDLVAVPAVQAWSLPSEPWVFVTDGEGTITARFEGAVDPAELGSAVGALGA
jgi:hypothetical protein